MNFAALLQALQALQQPATDAPWVEALKRRVDPSVDPNMERVPQWGNTDPGLNRTGPRVGGLLGT